MCPGQGSHHLTSVAALLTKDDPAGPGDLDDDDTSQKALDIDRLAGSGVHSKSSNMVDLSGDGNADYAMPMGPIAYWVQHYTFNVVVFAVLQLVSAKVFTLLLDDAGRPLGFGDALYHCMISATTVGFGDVTLYTEGARLFASFHILLSVSWLGASISQFEELKDVRTAQLAEFEHLQKKLDASMSMPRRSSHPGPAGSGAPNMLLMCVRAPCRNSHESRQRRPGG